MTDQKLNPKFVLLSAMLAAGLLGAVFVADQMVQSAAAQNSVHADRPTVTTSGTATADVNPDRFTVTVGVESNGTTAEEAAAASADAIAKVIEALKELGIAEQEISTSSYSVYPVYQTMEPLTICPMIYPLPPECQPQQVIVGYKAASSISVTLDADSLDAGEVIDAAVEAGANTVNGAFYFLSAELQQEVRDELIADAIESARHRADIAADAAGMEVVGVKSISLNDVYFPIFSRGFDVAQSTQILPGQQEVSMSASVTYFVQETS